MTTDQITPIVESLHKRAFNEPAVLVTDFGGQPPSIKNRFLYSEALEEFAGISEGASGSRYQFRVFKVDDEIWDFLFEPLPLAT